MDSTSSVGDMDLGKDQEVEKKEKSSKMERRPRPLFLVCVVFSVSVCLFMQFRFTGPSDAGMRVGVVTAIAAVTIDETPESQ